MTRFEGICVIIHSEVEAVKVCKQMHCGVDLKASLPMF